MNRRHAARDRRYTGTYGGRVRDRDPATSWHVAPILWDDLSELQSVILWLLLTPATGDELVSRYAAAKHPSRTPQRIRTARAQLVAEGLVRAAPEPGRSALGNRATLWQSVP